MKEPPRDPLAMQARTIGALCDDLFDIGARRSTSFARVDALREITKQRSSSRG
jgi:hypothetical protein